MTPVIGDIISSVSGLIAKFVPDADKRMEMEVQLAEIAAEADARASDLLQGQIEVNKEEAKSGNVFVAGWRPFIGWTCGVTLAYTWIAAPISKAVFHLTELPVVPTDQIYPIVFAMLGIGTLRTVEKGLGVGTGVMPGTTQQVPQVIRGPMAKVTSWFK